MTTKTQINPKTQNKKAATSAKPKKRRSIKRDTRPRLAMTKPKTKQAIIRNLIERSDGASISELTKATKWQAHSVRAAITGLRNAGSTIVRTKNADGVARYSSEVGTTAKAKATGA